MIPISMLREAAGRAAPHVLRTPIVPLGCNRWLKLECLQPTGSFKVRGFFAEALGRRRSQLAAGLITVSAGNAALACAHVAAELGVPCRVVMFDTAPAPKLDGVRRLGGEPLLKSRPELLAWMAERGWEKEPETFIHPFADPGVAAGHGGIGIELLEDLPNLERVLVPVGGGGLMMGIASALKQLRPEVEVIGVQSDGYPSWPASIEADRPAALTPTTIADGTSAPIDPGMFDRLPALVDRWLVVPEPRLRAAIPELAAAGRVVAEGAGALAFAALEQLDAGPVTAAIVSGGNIGPNLLAELLA